MRKWQAIYSTGFGTNLQFAPGKFNFVKTRAEHGTKEAFRLRDVYFDVPAPQKAKRRSVIRAIR